ncbi:MAG: hypothetical protein Q8Q09_05855 [Deltaproteobacteria bacterium]|nr:hypothetical protein [Deltaproteobacteria bacterium]
MPTDLFTLLLFTSLGLQRQIAPLTYPHFDMTDVVTFEFDDARLLTRRQRRAGAAWVTPTALPGQPLPLLIYLHGLNRDHIHHRWLHGSVWDMRTIVGPPAARGEIGPMAVAVPSTTGDDAQSSLTIYRTFDVAGFVEATAHALESQGMVIDRNRVIFVAHSASSCAERNGLFAGVGNRAVSTILNIDGCMNGRFGVLLGGAPAWQQVIVLYQDWMWARDYEGFVRMYTRHGQASGAAPSHRVLQRYEMRGIDVHNGIVPVAMREWLPRLVPPIVTAETSP